MAIGQSTIKKQLGGEWNRLHPAIQKRFEHEPEVGEDTVYVGHMKTRCSLAGKLFAHLTRVIGNPLAPYQGDDVPMQVRLYKHPNQKGTYWERTYHFPNKKPYVVTSVKQESDDRHMLECVGAGFGMVLKVSAENQQLHFKSARYFWQHCGRRIPLPHIITPGQTHVVHEDLGAGNFRFTITMMHPLLGRTFFQTGIFRREGE